VRIPVAETEVATVRTPGEEPVVFQTTLDFTIPAIRPVAYAIERGGVVKDVGVADGTARPTGADQLAFASPPVVGDALYLGFDVPLRRLLMQIEVDCSQARGAGVDPEDPPLRWEVSTGEDEPWAEADVLLDTTGGFNYGSGNVELQVPVEDGPTFVAGRRAHWLRCRLDSRTRSGAEGGAAFTRPPEIYAISGVPIGALIPASHAAREGAESLGYSDGTPGQAFRMRNAPILALDPGETLEVREPGGAEWRPWERRESFVESGPFDRHFVVDLAQGEVELGPATRGGDGHWRQHGAVPPKGTELRFTSYRHGGGRRGNVAPRTVKELRSAIPGVASVSNPAAARGGIDREDLMTARRRAALEFRTRYRAVNAEDFVFLAQEAASQRVARAVCVPPEGSGPVRLHILPRLEPADQKLEFHDLVPDDALLAEVAEYLDERRLIGTSLALLPVKLRGVSVVVNLQASLGSRLQRVEEDVAYALYTYLNPLVGGSPQGPGTGWEFGRPLNLGELYGVVHAVEGVDFVKILRVYETDPTTGSQQAQPAGNHITLESDELIASGTHIVKAEHREY
jgi:predicted phage baseplate assembly protein